MSKKNKTAPQASNDSKKPTNSVRDKSPVAQMLTWSESVKKEKAAIKIYENFTINPKNIHILTEKPNQNIIMAMRMKEKSENKNIFLDPKMINSRNLTDTAPLSEEILSKLNTINDSPKKKSNMPMTANQEIGWHTDTLATPKKSRFLFPKRSCKETEYANDYYTMNKISPFSNKFK